MGWSQKCHLIYLKSLRKIVPIKTMKLLYNAIVQPHFDIVYDSTSKTNKDRLQLF